MKSDPKENPVRVGLISLGCAKNLVDAEIMLGSLLKGGVQIINDAAQADVVIVNTCSFIDAAQEESVDTILQSAELREAKNRGQGLIVSGCLPQRFREELPKLLPEVDAFMGIDQVAQVTEIVHKALERRRQRVGEKSPKSKVQSLGSWAISPNWRRMRLMSINNQPITIIQLRLPIIHQPNTIIQLRSSKSIRGQTIFRISPPLASG